MSGFNRLAAALLRIDEASVGTGVEDRLKHAIEQLPDRQQEIVVGRFALDGGERVTLVDLGVSLGLTRERVRQLEMQALTQLRSALEDVA